MIDVIEINSTDGEITQLLDGGSALDVSQHRRLRLECERNKPAKPAGFILKLAQLAQMIDTLLERFDVAVEHGAGAAAPHPMPNPMDIEPFLGGFFAAANPIPHLGIKNFGAATGNGTKSVRAQKLERLRDRHLENSLSKMANFNGGKGFDVQIAIESAQSSQEFQVPLLFQRRVQTADHMDFGNSKR